MLIDNEKLKYLNEKFIKNLEKERFKLEEQIKNDRQELLSKQNESIENKVRNEKIKRKEIDIFHQIIVGYSKDLHNNLKKNNFINIKIKNLFYHPSIPEWLVITSKEKDIIDELIKDNNIGTFSRLEVYSDEFNYEN